MQTVHYSTLTDSICQLNVILIIAGRQNVSVFNFYNYLRTHPLLLRQKLASQADSKGMRAAAVLSGFSHAAAESDKVGTSFLDLDKLKSRVEVSVFFCRLAHWQS